MSRYNPWKHHRRSVHLPDHDYVDGVYFVTVCAHHHECLFGDVVDDMMHRNAFGDVVHAEWLRTEQVRPYVTLDAFVVMPNHFHAVLFILPDTPSVGATRRVAPTRTPHPNGPTSGSLGAIMGQFKSIVTKRINDMRDTPGGKVWQRSYYDTWLRTETMLNTRRLYVQTNPARWADDEHHPEHVK